MSTAHPKSSQFVLINLFKSNLIESFETATRRSFHAHMAARSILTPKDEVQTLLMIAEHWENIARLWSYHIEEHFSTEYKEIVDLFSDYTSYKVRGFGPRDTLGNESGYEAYRFNATRKVEEVVACFVGDIYVLGSHQKAWDDAQAACDHLNNRLFKKD